MFDVFSNLLQFWPFGRVFDAPAFGLQFITNRIGAFEIFCFASSFAVFQQFPQKSFFSFFRIKPFDSSTNAKNFI